MRNPFTARAPRQFERFAYCMAVVGILGDQLSTRLCLTHPLMYETNPFTVWNMEQGRWLPIDIFLLTAMITICALLIRRWGLEYRWTVLLCPFIFGSLRLLAAVHNLLLYILL